MLKKSRQSNIELLRIVAMVMITIVHLNGLWTFEMPFDAFSLRGKSLMLLSSLVMVGVNVFILISGYFGIKPTKKGGWNYVLWTMFYSAMLYSAFVVFGSQPFVLKDFINNFISLNGGYWFVKSYFLLFLFSPFLNLGCEKLSTEKLFVLVVLLLFADFYLGWWYNDSSNYGPYGIGHMIIIYLTGRLIKRYEFQITRLKSKGRLILAAGYLLCSFASMLLEARWGYNFTFSYNSIFLIVASVCFFMLFLTFNFENKVVNYVAGSAFSVYLLHCYPHCYGYILNVQCRKLMAYFGEWGYTFIAIPLIVIALFATVLVIDYFRKKITSPVTAFAVKISDKCERGLLAVASAIGRSK